MDCSFSAWSSRDALRIKLIIKVSMIAAWPAEEMISIARNTQRDCNDKIIKRPLRSWPITITTCNNSKPSNIIKPIKIFKTSLIGQLA